MRAREIRAGSEDIRIMLESGLVLREEGKLDEAEKIFRGINKLVPFSEVPLVALSSIAVRRGDLDEALRLCDKALQQAPDSVYARLNRAEILLYQQKRKEAENEIYEILEKKPNLFHDKTVRTLLNVAQMIPENKLEK